MLRFNVDYSMFFDKMPVKRAIDKASRDRLMKAGSFVRTTAKRSIRKRKSISEPGQQPRSHHGLLRKLIFFGLEPYAKTVVVGPMDANIENPPVPNLLEFGGRARRYFRWRGWPPRPEPCSRNAPGAIAYMARYRPRPFMGPALEAEAPNFPDLFKNSIRKVA